MPASLNWWITCAGSCVCRKMTCLRWCAGSHTGLLRFARPPYEGLRLSCHRVVAGPKRKAKSTRYAHLPAPSIPRKSTQRFDKMKIFVSFILSVVCILLIGCGGGSPVVYSLSGNLIGLNSGQRLVISNNGGENITLSANTSFSLPDQILQNGNWSVVVVSQPKGQLCTISNGSGSAAIGDMRNIEISCASYKHTIVEKFQKQLPVKAVLIGNSIGCGFYTIGWEYLAAEANSKLTLHSRTDDRVRSAAILLREKLQSVNAQSDLVNLSGSGWDTNDHLGIGRFPGEDTVAEAISMRPDAVFLALQVNDFWLQRFPV